MLPLRTQASPSFSPLQLPTWPLPYRFTSEISSSTARLPFPPSPLSAEEQERSLRETSVSSTSLKGQGIAAKRLRFSSQAIRASYQPCLPTRSDLTISDSSLGHLIPHPGPGLCKLLTCSHWSLNLRFPFLCHTAAGKSLFKPESQPPGSGSCRGLRFLRSESQVSPGLQGLLPHLPTSWAKPPKTLLLLAGLCLQLFARAAPQLASNCSPISPYQILS